MAAYGKGDFYYGSDLSDFSGSDGDLSEVWSDDDSTIEDEDDVLRYCICGLPATTDMIACDQEGCKIEWFHYECVSITAESIPEESWVCNLCRPVKSDVHAGAGTDSTYFVS